MLQDRYLFDNLQNQLDYSSRLPSVVSILLNVSPDHLERHKTFNKYISAKLKIFKGLSKRGVGFLDLSNDKQSRILKILKQEKYNIRNVELIKKKFHNYFSANFISSSLKGIHFKNCLYILSKIVKQFKVSNNIFLNTIKNFKGLPHRQEIIKIKNNLTFINDSKATNFSSTEVALNNYKNIHWILGGLAKANDKIITTNFKNSILKAYIIGKNIKSFLNQIKKRIESILNKNTFEFDFLDDEKELKVFIKNNISIANDDVKILIDKNNFVPIYLRWLSQVKPLINFDWKAAKKQGFEDCEFFLADLFVDDKGTVSIDDDTSIKDELFVVFKNKHYQIEKKNLKSLFNAIIEIKDIEKYENFWKKYRRSPLPEFHQYIIDRRDLLIPQDVRQRKGSFFTPQIWVDLSQKYIY